MRANLFLLLSFMCGLYSCKPGQPAESTFKLRFVNVSALSGDINAYMDYEKMYTSDIVFRNYTYFSKHLSTSHQIQVKTSGGQVIQDTNMYFKEGKHYTCFVFDQNTNARTLWIEEDFTKASGSFCKLRFMHLSNNSPLCDIRREQDTSFLFKQYLTGMFSSYIDLPVDSVRFVATESSTGIPFHQSIRKTGLQAGKFYSVMLTGNLGSTGADSLSFYWLENTSDY